MQIPKVVAEGIRDGRVSCAFRRWDAPRVQPGGTQLTPAGVVRFDSVEVVADIDLLTEADAVAAGERDLTRLRKWLITKESGQIYRIGLHYHGPDPRLALRVELPGDDELRRIDAALQRLDRAKPTGPWTRPILEWVRDNPAVVSKVLAALLDRDLQPMKTDIRKLKALGLTISLEVGYRLSPRGEAYLAWLSRADQLPPRG